MAAWGKLFVGLMLVFLIGIGATTLSWFPGSTSSAEERLQRQAEFALADANADWAQISVDGQKAILSGIAPNTEIQNETIAAVKDAVWGGGLILGGITAVDTRSGSITPTAAEATATPIEIAATEDTPPLPIDAAETVSLNDALPEEENAPTSTSPPSTDILSTEERDDDTNDTNIAVAAVEEAEDPTPPPAVEEPCLPTLADAIRGRDITFASARSEIDAASRAQLLDIAEAINTCPNFVLVIAGHTDSRGGASGNRRLSLYRADAVATYLRTVGVDDERLQTRGLGESAPIASNANAAGRAQNRRIEFTLIPDGSE